MGYGKTLLDYGSLEGGLVRMMERFKTEGSMTGDETADRFLIQNADAALIGMLFDQRVRAEYAFTGTVRLRDRLGHFDMPKMAAMDLEDLRAHFAAKPAVHRFTNVMAERTHAIAGIVAEKYDGSAANMWSEDIPFDIIQKRLMELPGFGKMKAHKMKFVLHYFGHRDFSDSSS